MSCQGSFAVTCLLRIGTIACHQRATALTDVFGLAARSPWEAHGGSVSFNVTELFPFVRPCGPASLSTRCVSVEV